jgi:virulence-associated protein VagC
MNNRSQHVTNPREFRFQSSEVTIRRGSKSGEVILLEIPYLEEVFHALDEAGIPPDFLLDRETSPAQERAALEGLV